MQSSNITEKAIREVIKLGALDRAKELISLVDNREVAARLEMECFTAGLWLCPSPAAVEAQIERATPWLKDVMWDVYQRYVELFGLKGARA